MTDEQLIEAMARRLAKDDGANWEAAHFGETPSGETPEEMRDYYRGLATAAVAALRKTHHLIPRAAGDDGELVGRLRKIGERVPVVCPDGIKGCLVFHFRVETDPTCAEAADAITALSAEVERLTRLTEAMATALENNGHPSTAKSLRAALGAKP